MSHSKHHHGSTHWWVMKISSLALIPLGLWLVYGLMTTAGLDQARVQLWLKDPVHAFILGLFLVFGLHHSANGIQVVLEDYVSTPVTRHAAIAAVKIIHLIAAGLGLFALIACVTGN
jgi:succinate dehydrogenase / fumarate reductase membrane anchor subunit